MSSLNHYDVIIIGTGAGGGTLAYHLAPSGKKILILERGDYVPREKDNWNPQAVNIDAKYNTKEPGAIRTARICIRTRITTWAGIRSFTVRPCSVCARKTLASCRHKDGISPAWPISYDELEPYYTQAEHLYQVHGNRGEDPTEPAASSPYRFPAVSHEPRIQQLADDFSRAGLNRSLDRQALDSAQLRARLLRRGDDAAPRPGDLEEHRRGQAHRADRLHAHGSALVCRRADGGARTREGHGPSRRHREHRPRQHHGGAGDRRSAADRAHQRLHDLRRAGPLRTAGAHQTGRERHRTGPVREQDEQRAGATARRRPGGGPR